jgi:hypothetical protein
VHTRQPWLYSSWAQREENRILEQAAAVLFNSPDLMSNYCRHRGNVQTPVQCLLNGTDLPAQAAHHPFPSGAKLVLRHFGTLYGGRSVEPLLNAFAAAPDVDRSRVQLELIGSDESCTVNRMHGVDDMSIPISAVPAVPHSEAVALMTEPAILVAVQSRNFSAQIPTKLYEYLRTGNPVLVLAAENSAVWQFASRFERCQRLDFTDVAGNAAIIRKIFAAWSAGKLSQVPADADTANFGKAVIGRDFASFMSSVLADGAHGDQSARRAQTHGSRHGDAASRSHGNYPAVAPRTLVEEPTEPASAPVRAARPLFARLLAHPTPQACAADHPNAPPP